MAWVLSFSLSQFSLRVKAASEDELPFPRLVSEREDIEERAADVLLLLGEEPA